MTYWLCAAGKTLRNQIAERWPGRDRQSDGWIGDSKHSSRTSDHNPDWDSIPPGVVRAIDIDEDLLGEKMRDPDVANALAESLRLLGGTREPRLRYVIFEGRIASRIGAWKWRQYSGPNPHATHIHVSFTAAGDHDGAPFDLEAI